MRMPAKAPSATRPRVTEDPVVTAGDIGVASTSQQPPPPRRLEREAEVCRRTGRHRSSIWRDVRSGLMPLPVRIGLRSVAWYSDEIDEWISSRPRLRRSTDSE
jgi:predicted DNA-binding transcriptional regulator AlpA